MLATLPSTPFGVPPLGSSAGPQAADAACFEFDVGFNPTAAEATPTPFQAVESIVKIPDGPGLGLTLDEAWLNVHLLPDYRVHVSADR